MKEAEIQELRTKLRGELITPGDASYETARKVHNATIDRRPALIARCADVADVIASVNFAREKKLLLAVRGGGHNAVRVDGGCLWGDVDHATHPFGLVPSGFISTTGVGGLTLGGRRRQLRGRDLVPRPGQPHWHCPWRADLLAAGQGGEAAPLLARLHPRRPRGHQRLVRLRDRASRADLPGRAPDEEGVRDHVVLHRRLREGGRRLRADSAALAAAHGLRRKGPVPALRSLFDGLYPAGRLWYWQADFFQELGDRAIDLHVKSGERLPSPHPTMHLYPINGAARRAGKGDTAFRFREATFAEVIMGVDPDPGRNPRLMQWAKDYWLALQPFSAGGGYVNMMMDEGEDSVKAAYRDNYARLAPVKRTYDPGNLFRFNQNIKPGDV